MILFFCRSYLQVCMKRRCGDIEILQMDGATRTDCFLVLITVTTKRREEEEGKEKKDGTTFVKDRQWALLSLMQLQMLPCFQMHTLIIEMGS